MMSNAELISITPPPVVTSSGGRTESAAVASGARIWIDRPKAHVAAQLGALVAGATAVAMVPLGSATGIVKSSRLTFELDRVGNGPVTMQVLHRTDYVNNRQLDHAECWLKAM